MDPHPQGYEDDLFRCLRWGVGKAPRDGCSDALDVLHVQAVPLGQHGVAEQSDEFAHLREMADMGERLDMNEPYSEQAREEEGDESDHAGSGRNDMRGPFPSQDAENPGRLDDVGPGLAEVGALNEVPAFRSEREFRLRSFVDDPEARVIPVELIQILHLLEMAAGRTGEGQLDPSSDFGFMGQGGDTI